MVQPWSSLPHGSWVHQWWFLSDWCSVEIRKIPRYRGLHSIISSSSGHIIIIHNICSTHHIIIHHIYIYNYIDTTSHYRILHMMSYEIRLMYATIGKASGKHVSSGLPTARWGRWRWHPWPWQLLSHRPEASVFSLEKMCMVPWYPSKKDRNLENLVCQCILYHPGNTFLSFWGVLCIYIYIDKSDHELTDITRMMKSRALILGSTKPWTFGPWIWIAAIRAMKLNKSSLGRRFTIMNHKLGWMMMDFYWSGGSVRRSRARSVRGPGTFGHLWGLEKFIGQDPGMVKTCEN